MSFNPYNSDKNYANRGVERNKKPLKNIVYQIEVKPLSSFRKDVQDDPKFVEDYAKYKFKEEGYIILKSGLQGKYDIMGWNGFRTPEYIKELLSEKQWSKFCQGKREFIIQRRIDGNNIKKKDGCI